MAKNSITTHPTIAHLLAILILILASGRSFCANANSMPADQLMRLSNRELCEKGQTHWDKNQLDSALICFNIVANRADRKQSREEMNVIQRAMLAMASIYEGDFFDYDKAMQYLIRAEKIAQTYDFELTTIYELMATLLNDKNNLLNDFRFDSTSFELHRKAFHLSIKTKKHQNTVFSIVNMITIAMKNRKLDLIKKELQIFQRLNIDHEATGFIFAKKMCDAAIDTHNQQFDSAVYKLSQLDSCLDMREHMRTTYKIVAHENLFFVYRDIGEVSSALHELNLFEQFAKEDNNKFGLIEVLLLKRNYYREQGNIVMADKYDLQYRKAKDEFIKEAKVAKADEAKVLFKLNEAIQEIKELSYRQRIQQTELIAVTVMAVLLLMLLVIGWMSYRRMQEKNQTLYQHNMQLIANEDRLRQLHQAEQQPASEPTTKYRRSNMEGEEISLVMSKVDRVMESSPEIYSTDFSLEQLAELTGESRIRLSQAINQVPGRTFYSILNGYRVREACRRMDDKEQYGGLTIEAIGQSVGFKNRSSFVAIFKRITGLTPSAYLKQPTAPDSPTPETHADNAEI